MTCPFIFLSLALTDRWSVFKATDRCCRQGPMKCRRKLQSRPGRAFPRLQLQRSGLVEKQAYKQCRLTGRWKRHFMGLSIPWNRVPSTPPGDKIHGRLKLVGNPNG